MIRRQIVFFLALATILLDASPGRADVVESWNDAILESVRTENTHPCVAARALAILHGTLFDVMANANGEQPFFVSENPPAAVDLLAALNCSAHTAATNLFPSRRAAFDKLYTAQLEALEKSSNRPASLRFGRNIADAWILWRSGDSSSGSLVYVPEKKPGAWRRTPPFHRPPEMQHWARVVPFTLVSSAQFRPSGPPALDSERYAKDLEAVRTLGAATGSTRTAYQTETAHFWSDFSYTVTPPGHWNQVALSVAEARRLDLAAKVKLFAVLNITMSDVAVACWDAKYVYNFWRPVTAIRSADKVPNSNTPAQHDWLPLLNTPAFPEYVSGHSAFSGAGAFVLQHFNGGDQVRFTVPSDSLPGRTRTFESLRACAEEVSQSRLYGGIHFPAALDDGLELGRNVARHVLDNYFLTSPAEPRLFTARGELNRSPWVGVIGSRGRTMTVEHLTSGGRWTVLTNLAPAATLTRWNLAELAPATDFRVRFN